VLSLQSRFGLSYQDAAHRLYMAEIAKLGVQKAAEHGFRTLRERLDKTITLEICPALEKIDGSTGKN
jgi:predicted transcriptional regulator